MLFDMLVDAKDTEEARMDTVWNSVKSSKFHTKKESRNKIKVTLTSTSLLTLAVLYSW